MYGVSGCNNYNENELLIQRYVYTFDQNGYGRKNGTFNRTRMLIEGLENEGNPNSNTYSILGVDCNKFEQFKGLDDKYTFKLVWYQIGGPITLIWKQSSCPQGTGTITGYEPISVQIK